MTEANLKTSSNSLLSSSNSVPFIDLSEPEDEIDYHLRLVDPSPERIKILTEEIQNLLLEGRGETIYEIGTNENGDIVGMSDEEIQKARETLKTISKSLNAASFLLLERNDKKGRSEVYFIRERKSQHYLDIRVAVCGNVDAGKSTFIGVLTKGKLDDGRGLARESIFIHKHEKESGRTSSISQQILGFNAEGECMNYLPKRGLTWGDIVEQSEKVISFYDLAGHEKYLKTTVSGMTGQLPDYCLIMVGANMGVTRMTKEHFGLALSLKIQIIVVVTKIDIAPENILKETLDDLYKILKMRGVRKMPMIIKTSDDLLNALKSIQNDRIVPIFLVSNVTGEKLDEVRKFLNALPPRINWSALQDRPPEVLIDQSYFVTGVGTVAGGIVMSGRVKPGQTLLLGPDGNGQFIPVNIKSIHSQRRQVDEVKAGMSTSLALKKIKRSFIRKGMVLVSPDSNPQASYYFESDVIILYHSTTIYKNYQPVVQCLTIRQSAKIVHIMNKDILRTGDKAKVIFKFMYRPEFLKVGMRVIFREGRCKGIGMITRVAIPEEEVLKLVEESEEKSDKQTITKDMKKGEKKKKRWKQNVPYNSDA